MRYVIILCTILAFSGRQSITKSEWKIPLASENRNDLSSISLTEIGQFGRMRKARKGIPAHHHTGIDIKRPGENYDNEPVFAASKGKVISLRDDGPYAQIIIEHTMQDGSKIWTAYEHVAGIIIKTGDEVTVDMPIARFMNKEELNRYGWQFDHFHFEVLKTEPIRVEPTGQLSQRFYKTYNLVCYTASDLEKYYHDPLEFLSSRL